MGVVELVDEVFALEVHGVALAKRSVRTSNTRMIVER
jgi:hypothetical protein